MNLCISKLSFQRSVREMINDFTQNIRFQKLIIDALQKAAKPFLLMFSKIAFISYVLIITQYYQIKLINKLQYHDITCKADYS